MIRTLANQTGARPNPSSSTATGQPFGRGIVTQFDGPALGRARMRAIRVPTVVPGANVLSCTQPGSPAARIGCAITASPTRYIRGVIRNLCGPDTTAKVNTAASLAETDTVEASFTGVNKRGAAQNVNNLPGASNTVAPGTAPVNATDGSCPQRAQFANGLFTGQYLAPVTEYIFAERIQTGTQGLPHRTSSNWTAWSMARVDRAATPRRRRSRRPGKARDDGTVLEN